MGSGLPVAAFEALRASDPITGCVWVSSSARKAARLAQVAIDGGALTDTGQQPAVLMLKASGRFRRTNATTKAQAS